ncbi:MAG: hypothetical protein ACAI34_16830 [Verrucomicrobium sp.]|nr:hypothetical protein [Verrucomicrobium sp.]
MTEAQKQALEVLKEVRLNQPKRTSREAYEQMDRMLEAQRQSSGHSSVNGPDERA